MVHEAGRDARFERDRGDGRTGIAVVGQHPRERFQNFGSLLLAIARPAHTLVG